MIWWGQRSDVVGERFWHTLAPLALSGVALVALLGFPALLPSILLLTVSVVATLITRGPFWALAAEWLFFAPRGGKDRDDQQHRDGLRLHTGTLMGRTSRRPAAIR